MGGRLRGHAVREQRLAAAETSGGIDPRFKQGALPTLPRVEVRLHRGEPILLHWYAHEDGEAVRGITRVETAEGRLSRVRNYFYTPDVIAEICREQRGEHRDAGGDPPPRARAPVGGRLGDGEARRAPARVLAGDAEGEAGGDAAAPREAYRKSSPHPERLPSFFQKSVDRMLGFRDWPEAAVRSIAAPTLVVIGDADVVRPEHAVEMVGLLPHARLAVLPLADHEGVVFARGGWLVPMVEAFLDEDVR